MVLTMQNRLAALVINITTRKGSDSHHSCSPQMGVAPDDVYSEYVSFQIFSGYATLPRPVSNGPSPEELEQQRRYVQTFMNLTSTFCEFLPPSEANCPLWLAQQNSGSCISTALHTGRCRGFAGISPTVLNPLVSLCRLKVTKKKSRHLLH